MEYIGFIRKQTKNELLRIVRQRIFDITVNLDLLMADPAMHELPSDLPVYIMEAEEETETLEKIEEYLGKIGEW